MHKHAIYKKPIEFYVWPLAVECTNSMRCFRYSFSDLATRILIRLPGKLHESGELDNAMVLLKGLLNFPYIMSTRRHKILI